MSCSRHFHSKSPPTGLNVSIFPIPREPHAVGSMVVFEQGVPSKGLYRRFNIKTVSGPDDFASMEEVLTRRFRRWQDTQKICRPASQTDPAFSILPDLLMVDGGKGQLGRAVQYWRSYDLQRERYRRRPGKAAGRIILSPDDRNHPAAAPFAGPVPAPAHPG